MLLSYEELQIFLSPVTRFTVCCQRGALALINLFICCPFIISFTTLLIDTRIYVLLFYLYLYLYFYFYLYPIWLIPFPLFSPSYFKSFLFRSVLLINFCWSLSLLFFIYLNLKHNKIFFKKFPFPLNPFLSYCI